MTNTYLVLLFVISAAVLAATDYVFDDEFNQKLINMSRENFTQVSLTCFNLLATLSHFPILSCFC